MADTILTLAQLNVLFQTITMQMLGLSMVPGPALDASSYKVRIAWPQKGSPAWKITEDVIFLQCFEIDNPYNRQREDVITQTDTENNLSETGFTIVNSINWEVYGPNSYDNIRIIKNKIFLQEYHDILARSNVYLIPDVPTPRRMPEKFEEQWWERQDLTMLFNELVIIQTTGKSIASAEINLQGENGSPIITTIE